MRISLFKKAYDVPKIKEDLTQLKTAAGSDREARTVIIARRLSKVVITLPLHITCFTLPYSLFH